jgi:transcriptional accessory protein Tex/SPT6
VSVQASEYLDNPEHNEHASNTKTTCIFYLVSRFVQDPINEYASMWTSANELGDFGHESWYLDLHPHKSLLVKSKAPLIRALENCLVDAVCEVGVDINMAAAHDHLAAPLAFVGGLGLRKAADLISQVKTKLRFVTTRKELLERKLLKTCVYNNAAGFLRICDNGSDEHMIDPFDDSRIHPECYVQNDFAPKIVASALQLPHNPERYIKNLALLTQHVKRELDKALKSNCKFNEAWMR